MLLKKRDLFAEIGLILSTGLALIAIADTEKAQLPKFSCHANDAADGWICEEKLIPSTISTIPKITRQPDNTGDIKNLSASAPQPVPASQQAYRPAYDSQTSIDNDRAALIATNTTGRYAQDWVPLKSLSAEQLAQVDGNCCGAFVDPTGR